MLKNTDEIQFYNGAELKSVKLTSTDKNQIMRARMEAYNGNKPLSAIQENILSSWDI